jgi:phosphoribosylglycinamide formyltransferase-1
MKRIVIVVSGQGSNMQAIVQACRAERWPAEVAAVVSNRPQAGGLAAAQALGLATSVVDHQSFDTREAFDAALAAAIDGHRPDLVLLAGFMRVLTPAFVQRFQGRMLNIHPSLLPAFGGKGMYGEKVHRAVLDYGAKVSGCTVHFADDTYDTGPILVQTCVPVREGDTPATLAARVFQAECEAYPEAIRLIAEGRVTVRGRRVVISG